MLTVEFQPGPDFKTLYDDYKVSVSGYVKKVRIAVHSSEELPPKYTVSASDFHIVDGDDGKPLVTGKLLWDDGSRPPEELVRVVALPEDEIGAYCLRADGTKEYLIFQTYDICMAYLGRDELCRGPERCYHK